MSTCVPSARRRQLVWMAGVRSAVGKVKTWTKQKLTELLRPLSTAARDAPAPNNARSTACCTEGSPIATMRAHVRARSVCGLHLRTRIRYVTPQRPIVAEFPPILRTSRQARPRMLRLAHRLHRGWRSATRVGDLEGSVAQSVQGSAACEREPSSASSLRWCKGEAATKCLWDSVSHAR